MNTSILRILYVIYCIELKLLFGNLVIRPQHKIAKVGGQVVISCSTDLDEPVTWAFQHSPAYKADKFFFSGVVVNRMLNEYKVDHTNGNYPLFIPSVNHNKAGKYICTDDESAGEKSSAELTVVGYTCTFDETNCTLTVSSNLEVKATCLHRKLTQHSSDHNIKTYAVSKLEDAPIDYGNSVICSVFVIDNKDNYDPVFGILELALKREIEPTITEGNESSTQTTTKSRPQDVNTHSCRGEVFKATTVTLFVAFVIIAIISFAFWRRVQAKERKERMEGLLNKRTGNDNKQLEKTDI